MQSSMIISSPYLSNPKNGWKSYLGLKSRGVRFTGTGSLCGNGVNLSSNNSNYGLSCVEVSGSKLPSALSSSKCLRNIVVHSSVAGSDGDEVHSSSNNSYSKMSLEPMFCQLLEKLKVHSSVTGSDGNEFHSRSNNSYLKMSAEPSFCQLLEKLKIPLGIIVLFVLALSLPYLGKVVVCYFILKLVHQVKGMPMDFSDLIWLSIFMIPMEIILAGGSLPIQSKALQIIRAIFSINWFTVLRWFYGS